MAVPEFGRPISAVRALLSGYLRDQLDTIIGADLEYRNNRPDAVHRIRVATYRARSAIDAFAEICGVGIEAARISAELRWLGLELGAARDDDVQHERLSNRLAALAPNQIVGPVHDRLDTHFRARHDQQLRRALDALTSARFVVLLDSLEDVLDRLEGDNEAPAAAKVIVVRLLERMSDRVNKRVRKVARAVGVGDRDVAAHRARKAVKRLRYVIEAARPIAPERTDQTLSAFIALQNILGEHQDSVVAQQQLLELADEAARFGESGSTYEELRLVESATAEDQLRKLMDAWRHARLATLAWCAE